MATRRSVTLDSNAFRRVCLPSRLRCPPVCKSSGRSIAAGAIAWLVATVLAFAVPALEKLAAGQHRGLGVGVVGTSIFLWQRSAARRGARGAQNRADPKLNVGRGPAYSTTSRTPSSNGS